MAMINLASSTHCGSLPTFHGRRSQAIVGTPVLNPIFCVPDGNRLYGGGLEANAMMSRQRRREIKLGLIIFCLSDRCTD